MTKVTQSCFAQLRQLKRIKPFLSTSDLEIVIHAFISSRLDYCNSLFLESVSVTYIDSSLFKMLLPDFFTGTKISEHITLVLATLHWLPVSFRLDFKILLLVFKALKGHAQTYISDLLAPYSPDRCLRSSSQVLLSVPRSRLVLKGDRTFAVRGPRLWNSLPEDLRQASSLSVFKSLLKK